MRNPVQRLGAIKLKLGALLGGGVVLTVVVLLGGGALGLPAWILALVALSAGLVLVDLLGSGLTAPLRQMARQADRLADGDPVDPVDDTARDEVGELARAFNRMAREVAHTDRVRRELVANVSHELRTPVAALVAQVQNLADGIEPAGPEQLRRMESQVARLRHLVDDLLDLSQLDAGAARLERREIDLRRLVVDVVHARGPVAVDRVEIRVPDEAAVAHVDPARFRQVVANLVDNALRHGPDDEPVTVSAARRDGALHLTVADTGPGIPAEDATRIFERFARGDSGRATTTGGAGLGLAITRWIVELHGGSIRVDRPGEPGGRLTVELSMASQEPTEPSPPLPLDDEPPSPASSSPAARWVAASTAVAVRRATPAAAAPADDGGGGLQLLPTPVTGLGRRGLLAVAAAAVAAALLPLEGPPGIGVAVVLLVGAAAAVVSLETGLDRFGTACCGIAAAIAALWAVTDAFWVLVPLTFGAVLLAGLGIWGPRRFGEAARAVVVGPLLTVVAPLALVRGARSQRGVAVGRVLVPLLGTLVVLLVFGGLLGEADAVFARALDAVVPDVRLDGTIVLRAVLAAGAAVVVTTYVLVQRAGEVATTPWSRPVRPVTDWAVPLGALVALLGTFVLIQLGTLFGGDDRVQSTTGLTYAEYARTGFGQLLVVAVLTLGVVAVVVRVAADDDRRLRDRMLGALVVLTFVVLASSVQRLSLYVDAFGLSRLRFSAYAALLWVAVILGMVVLAGLVRRFAPHLPRAAIVATGAIALAAALSFPDALIARVNLAGVDENRSDLADVLDEARAFGPASTVDGVDLGYLAGLSADAAPVLVDRFDLGPAEAALLLDGVGHVAGEACVDVGIDAGGGSWNLSRWRARRAIVDDPNLELCP